MALKNLKPITPGQRKQTVDRFDDLTERQPEKSLVAPLKKSGGRNSKGRITARYRGGGHKRRYRVIDFKREKHGVPAKVATIEYDPNRSARIALLVYADGEKRYIVAPDGVSVGARVMSGPKALPERGNSLPLSVVPLGTFVHAVEMKPGKGAQLARSAGTFAQLVARSAKTATLKLPSGEIRQVPVECYATIGTTSNPEHMNIDLGKAGRNRWIGRRPKTRGVAMNPVDHPMGGGEGKASGGHPRSRSGQPAKGYRTRKKNNPSDRYIVRRRHRKP